MDPTHVRRLKEEHQKGLQSCQEKISQWTKFKSDYEVLRDRLHDLPDKLSYDITVPFGSNAFVEGKMVHTNEVTVLLGDGWFAQVSSKQATEIASRRIKHCVKMLEDLEKEKEQFQNWLNYINEVSTNEDLVEIVEEFDPVAEEKWRERHARNVKAYHKQQQNLSPTDTDLVHMEEDMLDRMSSLELAEEESETKSIPDSENSTFDYSDDGSMLSESPRTIAPFFPHDNLIDPMEEGGEDTCTNLPCNSPGGDHSMGCEKHVRWQDQSKKNMKKITFKHSRSKKNQVKSSSPTESGDLPLIQSPSDIYKQFGNFFPSSPPKSILKVKHSPPIQNEPSPPSFPASAPAVMAFTGEICEHSDAPQPSAQKTSRPVSHFKSSRQHKRK